MKRLLAMLTLVLLTAAAAYATTYTCNIDDLSLTWTGKTKVVNAKQLFEHKCIQNHYFWLTNEQMNTY